MLLLTIIGIFVSLWALLREPRDTRFEDGREIYRS